MIILFLFKVESLIKNEYFQFCMIIENSHELFSVCLAFQKRNEFFVINLEMQSHNDFSFVSIVNASHHKAPSSTRFHDSKEGRDAIC